MVRCGFRNRAYRHNSGRFTGTASKKGYIAVNQPAPLSPKTNTAAPAKSAPTAVDPQPVPPSPTVPTAFGIYAVSGGKLHELDVLPGRAPDPAHCHFIHHHGEQPYDVAGRTRRFRHLSSGFSDQCGHRAEVRVVARIEREASFGKDGKQVVTAVDDNWVMRNISMPYRTAPRKDNPEMYEVRSENPDAPLPPGRYALVLKGLAYDFSVAGPVTDPRQCLERLVATKWPVLFRVQEVTADEPFCDWTGCFRRSRWLRKIMSWTQRCRARQLFGRALQARQEVLTPRYVPR